MAKSQGYGFGAFFIALLLGGLSAAAGPLGEEAFKPTDPRETFESLSNLFGVDSPLVVGSNTFQTSSGTIRLFSLGTQGNVAGQCYPQTQIGTCIGTGLEDLESISVEFGTPKQKAGLWVGLGNNDPWTATVWFSSGNVYLGSVDIVGPGHVFVGWESKNKKMPITKIVVEDTATNSRIIAIDGVVWTAPKGGRPPR